MSYHVTSRNARLTEGKEQPRSQGTPHKLSEANIVSFWEVPFLEGWVVMVLRRVVAYVSVLLGFSAMAFVEVAPPPGRACVE